MRYLLAMLMDLPRLLVGSRGSTMLNRLMKALVTGPCSRGGLYMFSMLSKMCSFSRTSLLSSAFIPGSQHVPQTQKNLHLLFKVHSKLHHSSDVCTAGMCERQVKSSTPSGSSNTDRGMGPCKLNALLSQSKALNTSRNFRSTYSHNTQIPLPSAGLLLSLPR